ncbi:hypothetical protein [Ekhidna sp.]|uniref:hypothetical protein n=1 Tax=Ekhidna sp. TaxID=2608089 RepID=UPI003B51193F
MRYLIPILFYLLLTGCNSQSSSISDQPPGDIPIVFEPDLVPEGKIIHRGVFSNDLKAYYFTISDPAFTNFDILVSERNKNIWNISKEAFFNSKYDDHGMSFSPDGNTLVFCSTRPVDDLPQTWHIWKSEKINSGWSTPLYIEIPNLKNKLLSHPTLMPDGTLYFHASELDYSNMKLYYSSLINGKYQNAEEITFETLSDKALCTPYLSASGTYLIFATIGQSLELHASQNLGGNSWSDPLKLPDEINSKGQGNPYLTPDSKYLFYASEKKGKWKINWVNMESFFKVK